jgi:hypothetical protein
VTLDLIKHGAGTDVRRLTIADGFSDASISLGLRKTELEVGFTGRLASATLQELFARERRRRGRIEGDFHALVSRDRLGKTSASGTLRVADVSIPTPAGEITTEALDVRAAGNRLTVSSSFALDEQHLSITGGATLQDGGIALDLDVAAGPIAWERVEKVVDRLDERKKAAGPAKDGEAPRPPLPISGIVRLSIDSFTFRNFAWKPVLADIELTRESVTATVRKADVCGISTTGALQFPRGGAMSVRALVASAGPDITPSLACLGVEKAPITGGYEAYLQVEGKGEAAELPRALQGPLTFRGSTVTIGKNSLLTKILGVVNMTGALRGKSRERLGEAMTFDDLTIEGQVENGRLSVREAALKSPSFTMAASGTLDFLGDKSIDFMVLTYPFSTVDKIIRVIPVLRYILGRKFLSVATEVKGTLEDPKIRLAPARDVGEGLVNILKRTAKLPVHVFDPS